MKVYQVEPCALLSLGNDNVKCLICNWNQEKEKNFKNYHQKDENILFSTKRYTFTERYDKQMDLVRFQQLAFLMFLKFVSVVVTLCAVDIYIS